MYCDQFGFIERPFEVTPDPRFLFRTREHQEALASLIYGIRERRGFIALMGEVGTGKTTLLNAALDRLDEKIKVASIFNTNVNFGTLLMNALADLDVSGSEEPCSESEAVNRLNRLAISRLRAGGNIVLIVDEAQNLDFDCMENLRLLSNLETRKHKLIQIVLSGQPELDRKLRDPRMRQLNQRISMKRYIVPLSEADTYRYIDHRLKVAQYHGPSLFGRRARQRIWEFTGGIPRKINILCDNALLIAYSLGERKVKEEILLEAIQDLTGSPFSQGVTRSPVEENRNLPGSGLSRFKFAAALGSILLLLLGTVIGLYLPRLSPDYSEDFNDIGTAAFSRKPVIRQGVAPSHATQPRESMEGAVKTRESPAASFQEMVGAEPEPIDFGPVPVEVYPPPVEAFDGSLSNLSNPGVEPPGSVETYRELVVRPGDTLFGILDRIYGNHNEETIQAVRNENPELSDLNFIVVGQEIRLPVL